MVTINGVQLKGRAVGFVRGISSRVAASDDLLRDALRDELSASTEQLGAGSAPLRKYLSETCGVVLAGIHWFLHHGNRYIVTDIGIDKPMDDKVRDYGDIWAKLRPGAYHLARLLPTSTLPEFPTLVFRLPRPGTNDPAVPVMDGAMSIPRDFVDHVILGSGGREPVFVVCHLRETTSRAKQCVNSRCGICGSFWKALGDYIGSKGIALAGLDELISSFFLSFYVSLTLLQKGDVDLLMGKGGDVYVVIVPDAHGTTVHSVAAMVFRVPDKPGADPAGTLRSLTYITTRWLSAYSEELNESALLFAHPPAPSTPEGVANSMFRKGLLLDPPIKEWDEARSRVESAARGARSQLGDLVRKTEGFCKAYLAAQREYKGEPNTALASLAELLGDANDRGGL